MEGSSATVSRGYRPVGDKGQMVNMPIDFLKGLMEKAYYSVNVQKGQNKWKVRADDPQLSMPHWTQGRMNL